MVKQLAALVCTIFVHLIGPWDSRADSISPNPIVFVTLIPNPLDFGTLAATFGNHVANPESAFRGGDLWIRYPDGSLKNLTSAAGFGNAGFQGAGAIAVRDPSVHWDGSKIIFSMVVGAPTQQYQVKKFVWQLYEATGIGQSESPVITKVANQPAGFNNHSPIYATDDSIIFVSDRPRDDSVLHTYPQRDEYESSPVNTGLWKLNPSTGTVALLDHAPSGDFNPIIDSFGRVIFTRWDHLQRDQQNVGASMGAFNFSSEASTVQTSDSAEVFPEPRSVNDPDYKSNVNLFTINQFFPWMMREDGTGLETLNHVGRQEIGIYSERSFNDDPNVQEFYGQYSTGQNQNEFTIFLHIKENPSEAGTYFGTNCQEFGTHAAGQLVSITGAPNVNPDNMLVTYLTHPDTAGATDSPSGNHTGLYRDPLPLVNGNIVASHTSNTRQDSNLGTSSAPLSRYDFRLKLVTKTGGYYTPGTLLTAGISKSVSFWSPDRLVSYSGNLWEVMPAEVKTRTRPSPASDDLPAVEAGVLSSMNVQLADLKSYLTQSNLALIISRNVTMRDRNDRQQPTNLRITGSSTETIPHSGKIYDLSLLQILQGDLIRGYTSGGGDGRRVLAQPMHSVGDGINPLFDSVPGSVQLAEDGSMAAFVPARRALSWQLSAADGTPIVRERYWLTFQLGEVRVCANCHGINTADHLGRTAPQNPPLALARLLAHWKSLPMPTPTPSPFSLSFSGIRKAGSRYSLKASGSASGGFELRASVNASSCRQHRAFPRAAKRLNGIFPENGSSTVSFRLHARGNAGTVLAERMVRVAKRAGARSLSAKAACRAIFSRLTAPRG